MIGCRSPLFAAWLMCAACAASVGCGAPPASPSPPLHAPATATRTASLDPAPAPAEPRDWKTFAASVARAYDLRASGDIDGARAAFRALVAELVALGESASAGLGDLDGDLVLGRKIAGFSVGARLLRTARGAPSSYGAPSVGTSSPGGGRAPSVGTSSPGGGRAPGVGTWFFDAATGEPTSFAPDVRLRRGAPPLDEPYFAVTDSAGTRLFDRVHSSYPDLPGTLIALHPDGHRVYLLGEDCQLREWGLATAQVIRALDAHYHGSSAAESGSRMECDGYGFRDAAVTADGKWLTTRFGRWDLTTGKRRKLPFYWDADSYFPAVSLDGRYVARIAPNPGAPKESYAEVSLLVLHDLDTGKSLVAKEKLGVLSNGDPLSFGASPARVCIFDYGFHAFAVPSLRRFAPDDGAFVPDEGPPSFGPDSCDTKFVRPPPDHPEILARLASRVCTVGGFLVPIEHC